MKRIIILLLSIWMGITAYALNKQTLADTLTAYAKSKAYVGNVNVQRVRVRNQLVWVYTNGTLGQLSLTPSDVQELRLLVSQVVLGNNQGKVTLYTGDYEIGELVTSLYRHRAKNARYTLPATTQWVTNTSRPYTAKQGLEGKHIALWGSHGQYYHQPSESWRWQRAKVWSTVEDLYTTSYTMPFLVPMLENAGAVVVQPRERDTQVREVVVDDASLQIATEVAVDGRSASPVVEIWEIGDGTGWGEDEDGVLMEGENPFERGGYLVETRGERLSAPKKSADFSGTPQAKGERLEAKYIPELEEGDYAVYVSYKTLPNSTSKAQYTVVHKGQKTIFSVNQKMGGGTWVYLGTFAFDGDKEKNYVSVAPVGNGKEVVTTDAVKFGGGMGNVARYKQPDSFENVKSSNTLPDEQVIVDSLQYLEELAMNQANAVTSGLPRYIEAARYWMQYAGIPDSIYNYTNSKNDYVDDYASRGIWVNYLAGGSAANPKQAGLNIPVHMSLAFHTDAGVKKDMIGTLIIYKDHDDEKCKTYPTGKSRILNRDLADYMQTQIVEDMRQLYAPEWTRRQLDNSSYAEVRHPKVPAVLLELLSHQNMTDMQYGLDPRVRFVISRAMYKSILRFMHEQYGTEYVVQPLPVQQMAMRLESGTKNQEQGQITVAWEATEDKLEPTAVPSYYIVYTRTDEGDWDNGVRVNSNEYRWTPEPGKRYDIRVAAGNAGGLSMKSEVLTAYIAPEEKGRVLIVNGFTRVSGPEWWSDSIYGGIRPMSHAVPYGKGVNYIGEVYDYDSRNEWVTDDNCGWGMCHSDHMDHPSVGNTFDYPVMHGKVLQKMGYSYITTSVAAVDSIAGYDAVDVILGKQKTTVLGKDTSFHCMPANLRHALTNYLQAGGRLLLSGAHIASDMTSEEDKAFVKEQLHYEFRTTHASKTGKLRVERMLKKGNYSFRTEPNETMLHTENADGIYPAEGGVVVARFPEANVAAAIGYEARGERLEARGERQEARGDEAKGERREARGEKTLCWSIMLESAYEFEALYRESMEWVMRKTEK